MKEVFDMLEKGLVDKSEQLLEFEVWQKVKSSFILLCLFSLNSLSNEKTNTFDI